MADEKRWTSTDRIESLAAEQNKADPSGQPSPDEAPPVPRDVLSVPREGLARHEGKRKKVLIIGAGMSGLVAAYELKRQGHEPLILEAQGRVGGRVYTLREPFAPGLYAEAGAMRIPRAHNLTLEYCSLFNLPMRPFVMGNPKGIVYVGGQRMTAAEANEHPEKLPFNLSPSEHGHSADDLWQTAIADLKERVEKEGQAAWPAIVKRYDEFSLYEFLRHKGFSQGAIEFYAVMNFVESDLHNSFIEVLREELGGAYVDMQSIVGGMDLLPGAFYNELQECVRFGAEVRSIEQDADGVKLHCRIGPDRRHVRRRLRDLHGAVLRAAADRGDVLAREGARDPAAQLPRVDQDPAPGAPPILGEGRRHRGRRHRHRPTDPAHELPAD